MIKKIFLPAFLLHVTLLVSIAQQPENAIQSSHKSIIGLQRPELTKQDQMLTTNFMRNALKLKPMGLIRDTNNIMQNLVNNFNVDGVLRFSTIFRNMNTYYADMTTSDKNISFVDYPVSNSGAAQLAGYPMMEMSFSSKLNKNVDFNVGYSIFHSLSGAVDLKGGKSLTVVNNFKFNGNVLTPIGKITVNAGAGLTAALSRMTMGMPQNRDDYFDRLPWDWYRKSFLRYDEYYSMSTNVGSSPVGRSQFQGFTLNSQINPLDMNVMFVVGRSNFTVANSNIPNNNFPALLYAGRVEKVLFTRSFNAKVGLNVYTRHGNISPSSDLVDQNSIVSLDWNGRIKKVIISAEIARGDLNNPLIKAAPSYGGFLKIDVDKKLSTFPIGGEIYYIPKNMVSLDGGMINSNQNVRVGGFVNTLDATAARDFLVYDPLYLPNLVQEVGILSNNRMGLNLKAEKKLGKFGFQISNGISREIENNSDTITIQHRVNAFSASRFRPWFQAAGPYGRINSNWRRTYERFTINDKYNGDPTNYYKYYNSTDIFLKFKTKLAGRDLLLFNFTNFSSIQDGFSPIANFYNDKPFVKSIYNAFDVAYKLSTKYTLVAQYAVETVLGNRRIDMVTQDGTTVGGRVTRDRNDANAKTVNQLGQGVGVGIDYDFSPTAGLHLRHKYMWHEDKNFVLDKYDGHETYLELKIFFK